MYNDDSFTEEQLLEARNFISNFRSKALIPPYMLSGSFSKVKPSLFKSFYFFLQYLYHSLKVHDKADYMAFYQKNIHLKSSAFYIKYKFQKKYYQNPRDDEKYFLFPLHFQPEASTLVAAPNFEKQMYAMDLISKNIPIGRIGTTNDVAETVNYLISEESSYITGQTINLNGEEVEKGRLTKLFIYQGTNKVAVETVNAGDIICIAGLTNSSVADTICDYDINTPIEIPFLNVPGFNTSDILICKYNRFPYGRFNTTSTNLKLYAPLRLTTSEGQVDQFNKKTAGGGCVDPNNPGLNLFTRTSRISSSNNIYANTTNQVSKKQTYVILSKSRFRPFR